MRGHEPILELRKRGKKPPIVFLCDFPCDTGWTKYNDHPTVSTAGDRLSSIDMRFLVDLKVSIASMSESRAKALYRMAIDAGAETVAAGHHQPNVSIHQQDGWQEVYYRG